MVDGGFRAGQTRGKSWYWTTAGMRLIDLPMGPGLLKRRVGSKLEAIDMGGEKGLRLAGWQREGEAVVVELRMIDHSGESTLAQVRVKPIPGGVQLVFTSTEPSLVVVGPMNERFETVAGPAKAENDRWNSNSRFLSACSATDGRSDAGMEAGANDRGGVGNQGVCRHQHLLRRGSCRSCLGTRWRDYPLPDGPMPTAMVVRTDGSLWSRR